MDHKKTTVNISEYRLKSVTVSQAPSGKYYASILFEYEDQVQERELQKFLGYTNLHIISKYILYAFLPGTFTVTIPIRVQFIT